MRDDLAATDQSVWAEAYINDLKHDVARLTPETGPATSLFFGGGTPSLMNTDTVATVIEAVDRLVGLAPGAEITLEANPTSVEASRFQNYVTAGINRFSLGVQALRGEDLKELGRQHSVAEALTAMEVARKFCDNVSFDLIYARPGQTLQAWREELDQALAFEPSHISLYQLTIERGTRFFEMWRQGTLVLPEEDLATDMFELTNATCEANGLLAYEVSNHARPGMESRHNISYWQSDPYMGIGPGAHGRLQTDTGRLATTRFRSPEKWLSMTQEHHHGTETEDAVAGDMLLAEILMMGLRLNTGINEDRFKSLTGQGFNDSLDTQSLNDLIEDGFLSLDNGNLATTPKGRNVLNAITEKLLV